MVRNYIKKRGKPHNWNRAPTEVDPSDIGSWFDNARKKCHCKACGAEILKGQVILRFRTTVLIKMKNRIEYDSRQRQLCTPCSIAVVKKNSEAYDKAVQIANEQGAYL